MRQPVRGGALGIAQAAEVDDEGSGVAARGEGGGVREGIELACVARVGSAHAVGVAEACGGGGRR